MTTSATPSVAGRRPSALPYGLVFLLPFLLVACQIIEVEQPEEAAQNEEIEINVTLGLYTEDENPHRGVLSILVPNDWTFLGGSYDGDVGSGDIEFSEAWSDSTDIVLPPPAGMKWIGTTSEHAHAVPSAPAFVDVELQLRVGATLGTFPLGYFFTSDAFATEDIAFTKSGDYDDNTADSLMNQWITVVPKVSTEETTLPGAFTLEQNFPNPVRSSTQISYELERGAEVRVVLYSIAGRELVVIDQGKRVAGPHTVSLDASELASGLYLYRLEVDGQVVATRSLTRVR